MGGRWLWCRFHFNSDRWCGFPGWRRERSGGVVKAECTSREQHGCKKDDYAYPPKAVNASFGWIRPNQAPHRIDLLPDCAYGMPIPQTSANLNFTSFAILLKIPVTGFLRSTSRVHWRVYLLLSSEWEENVKRRTLSDIDTGSCGTPQNTASRLGGLGRGRVRKPLLVRRRG